MRLIDAKAFAEHLERLAHTARTTYPNLFPGLFEAVEYVKDFPAVDAVPVVRCKDCKWGKTWKNAFGIEGFKCDLLCVDLSPEAFCSYGVRKEGQA